MIVQKQPQKILEGQWNDNLSWEFYLDERLPDAALCTAVYCLAIVQPTDQIVLTRITRGWEMLGGHIEQGETIENAMVREALEEGGFSPQFSCPYGYMKVTAKNPAVNDHHGGTYPPVAYIPYFLVVTKKPLLAPTGQEVLESRSFNLNDIVSIQSAHEPMIRAGLEKYNAIKMNIQLP